MLFCHGANGLGFRRIRRARGIAVYRNPVEASRIQLLPERRLFKGVVPKVITTGFPFCDNQILLQIDLLLVIPQGFPDTGTGIRTANYMVNMVELRNWMDPDEEEDE